MYIMSTPVLSPPFAGCPSALSASGEKLLEDQADLFIVSELFSRSPVINICKYIQTFSVLFLNIL